MAGQSSWIPTCVTNGSAIPRLSLRLLRYTLLSTCSRRLSRGRSGGGCLKLGISTRGDFLVVKKSSPRAVWTYYTCTLLLFVINITQEWNEDTDQNDSTNNNNDQHTALSLPILFRFLDRLFESLVCIIHTRCGFRDLAITSPEEMHVHLNLVDALSLLVHE